MIRFVQALTGVPFFQISRIIMFVLTFASAHAQINVSFNVTEPSCFGLPDGSITAIPSGGAPPYAYVWNTGATVQTLNNIPAGAYSVTVTSSNGFTGSGTRVIAQPDLVVVDFITEECSLPLSPRRRQPK